MSHREQDDSGFLLIKELVHSLLPELGPWVDLDVEAVKENRQRIREKEDDEESEVYP